MTSTHATAATADLNPDPERYAPTVDIVSRARYWGHEPVPKTINGSRYLCVYDADGMALGRFVYAADGEYNWDKELRSYGFSGLRKKRP